MTYRFSRALGYFNPTKTNDPSAASTFHKMYGEPTCYGGRKWFWIQAPTKAWSTEFDQTDFQKYYGGFANPACVFYCEPPGVDDPGCDAGIAPPKPGAPAAPKPAAAPATSTTSEYPWKAYSASTVALQKEANKKLSANGYNLISTDGKLGPGTCGAVKAMGMSVPSTCQSFTSPTKKGSGAAAPPVVVFDEPPKQRAGMSLGAIAIVGGAVVAVGAGAFLYFRRRA